MLDWPGIGKPYDTSDAAEDQRVYAQRMSILKIFAPCVLPLDVLSIIWVDMDMFWIKDIDVVHSRLLSFSVYQLMGIAPEPSVCTEVQGKPYNPESKNGFPGFNGGLQIMALDKMRLADSWWFGDSYFASVKKALKTLGPTSDQDLYNWLYHVQHDAFNVLPRSLNLQLCGFCPRITGLVHGLSDALCMGKGMAETGQANSDSCSLADIAVLHGNCDEPPPSEVKWKKLIYAMIRRLHEEKLKVERRSSDGRVTVTDQAGKALEWPLLPPLLAPTCKSNCEPDRIGFSPSLCAWDTRVCRLMAEVFAHPPVPANAVPVFDPPSGFRK